MLKDRFIEKARARRSNADVVRRVLLEGDSALGAEEARAQPPDPDDAALK